ncbi:hypothetical protein, partial [Nocardia aobensis]|uniref:hypothetical protein n=1 Tax=Nocardia aobensis TaxID=257277 RepID=UPI001C3F2E37
MTRTSLSLFMIPPSRLRSASIAIGLDYPPAQPAPGDDSMLAIGTGARHAKSHWPGDPLRLSAVTGRLGGVGRYAPCRSPARQQTLASVPVQTLASVPVQTLASVSVQTLERGA